MFKPLAHVLPVILAALAASGAQAAQTDKLTGLPVNPDLTYSNPQTTTVCSTQVHTAIYTARRSESLKTVSAWYASHLRGFTQIHGAISDRPTEAFVNADGTIIRPADHKLTANGGLYRDLCAKRQVPNDVEPYNVVGGQRGHVSLTCAN